MTEHAVALSSESPLSSIFGPNPLLSALGSRTGFHDWPARLTQQPLKGCDITGLNATAREELLLLYKQHFVATRSGINIVAALQNIHREHYWQRHPCNPSVTRIRAQIAQFIRSPNFQPMSIPWLSTSASGMIIKGITGTGKTSIITRYTDLLGEQVHEHFEGAVPGYNYVKQIVWLKVDMSSDGSRDGFLTSILLEVDRLIGTNYTKQYSGRFSVDKLAIVVAVILSTHLCGLLIIEEIQEKNFNDSKWHNPLTTFFLRVLNFGTPTVLIGNPLGFCNLEKSSQNVRRLSSGGIFEMSPAPDEKESDFRFLTEETFMFSVMLHQNERARKHFCDVAYRYSGGITDFVVRLNVESQLIALRLGAEAVLPEHIDAAYMTSPRLVPNHNLIEGLVQRDPNKLNFCDDVPVEYFVKKWLREKTAERHSDDCNNKTGKSQSATSQDTTESSDASRIPPPQTANSEISIIAETAAPRSKSDVSKQHPSARNFKSEQTRKANGRKKAADLKGRLSPKDIRTSQGQSEGLVSALSELLKGRS